LGTGPEGKLHFSNERSGETDRPPGSNIRDLVQRTPIGVSVNARSILKNKSELDKGSIIC
jgi:hypothetical protein